MYYKIGTLAKRFGITTQAIRFYEKQGLLFSRFEEDSNTRRYHTRNIKWLSSIRRYHEMGFGMKEIQQLFLCEKPEELNMQMNAHEENSWPKLPNVKKCLPLYAGKSRISQELSNYKDAVSWNPLPSSGC